MTLLVVFGVIGLAFSSHFYFTIFEQGVDSDYISIKSTDNNILNGELNKINSTGLSLRNRIWDKVHVQNFKVPAPFSHPLVNAHPLMNYLYDRSEVGFIFNSTSGAELIRFYENKKFLFRTEMDKNKLFSIPLVREIVFAKSQELIFKDMFLEKLFFGESSVPEYSKDVALKILTTDWKKLIYNLFIYKLRLKYFNFEGISKISWQTDIKAGVISYNPDETGEIRETIYYLNDGVIFSLDVFHKEWNSHSRKIRDLFLYNSEYSPSKKDSSIEIYGEYRLLEYRKQIGHDGMILLLSAWSHHQGDKKFLKEMIQRLERGKENKDQLRALYKYALRRYKETFSSKEEINKRDSVSKKLERSVLLEQQKRKLKEQEEIKNYQELEEMDFNSGEEKMDYFLEEALRKEQQ